MKDYLDDNTRICLKWHLPALDNVLALQRRKWYGWKTVSWIYPSIMKNNTCQYIREWLQWEEGEKKKKKEGDIGKQLMTMCDGKF